MTWREVKNDLTFIWTIKVKSFLTSLTFSVLSLAHKYDDAFLILFYR